MRKILGCAVGVGMLALSGCGAVTPPAGGGGTAGNLAACEQALLTAGTIDPTRLALAAATSPGCIGLASDLIQQLIGSVRTTQMRRGVRQ